MVARPDVSFDPSSSTANPSSAASGGVPCPGREDSAWTSSPCDEASLSRIPVLHEPGNPELSSGSPGSSGQILVHNGAESPFPAVSPPFYQGAGITRPVPRRPAIREIAESGSPIEDKGGVIDSTMKPLAMDTAAGKADCSSVLMPDTADKRAISPSPQGPAPLPESGKYASKNHEKKRPYGKKKSGAPVSTGKIGTVSASAAPATQDDSGVKGAIMPFYGHLAELRKRIMFILAIFIPATFISFSFAEKMSDFILSPATGLKFVYLSPPDLFMALVKLSIVAGIAFSMPVIIFQIWMFVQPALARKERGAILVALLFSGLFFAAGAGFAFFVIVPISMKFFLSYSSSMIEPMISIKEYLGFISDLCLAFGLTFELPIASALLGALGVLKADFFIRTRKIAVLGIFIAAAILTPPDIISQVLLALPMLLLFELSVWILKIQAKRRSRRELQTKSAD